ncbi:MAG: hypothetical protein ACKOGA_10865 [Planctomycetaceae bacterium]
MPVVPSARPAAPCLTTRTLAGLALLTLIGAVYVGFTSLPLGVPSEWVWTRKTHLESPWFRWPGPLCAAIAYWFFIRWLTRPAPLRSGRAAGALLPNANLPSPAPPRGLGPVALLAGAALAWLLCLLQSAPPGFDLAKAGWVLYYPGPSGYFTQARHHTEASRQARQPRTAWLTNYEQTVATGDVLHLGTHPPGLVLALQGLIALVEAVPPLAPALRAIEPTTVELSFAEIARLSARPGPPQAGVDPSLTLAPLSANDRAVLWLAMLLTVLAGALTVIPLWGLLRRALPERDALLLAAFWPTLPALAIFLPKSDGVFPLLGCGCLWAWNEALLARTGPRRTLLALVAGVVLWLGLLCSLAFLVIVAAGWLLTLAHGLMLAPHAVHAAQPLATPAVPGQSGGDGTTRWAGPLTVLGVGLATLLVATVVFTWLTGCNLGSVWRWNYLNHSRFYQQFTRTWWAWLLVNPLELLLAAGPPVVGLAGWALVQSVRGRRVSPVAGGLAIAWSLVYLSGKNRGEAARLWLLLMPTLLLVVGDWLNPRVGPRLAAPQGLLDAAPGLSPQEELATSVRQHRQLLRVLALQLGYAWLVVSTVVGFA